LGAGPPYADFGGFFYGTRDELERQADAERAGVACVICCGLSPGLSNVMARYLVDRLRDEQVSLFIRAGLIGGGFGYSLTTIIDELTTPPVIYHDGEWHEVEPRSGREPIDFGPEVGVLEAIYALHSEMATFPLTMRNVHHVDFKVGF